jgi:hypothetical protein
MSGTPSRLAFGLVALLATAPVQAQGFFGPQGPTAWMPEVDAYFRVADGVRLQAQVQPYLVPAQNVSQVNFGIYGSWLVADVLRELLSPDKAKTHAVDMRVGLLYCATLDPGTQGPGNLWILQAELTPRFNLPGGILSSVRNRVSFNWAVDGASGFFFVYRGRFQLEREIEVGRAPITPYVNVEFLWQQQPAMWTQFRIQGGLQVGFDLFARGQTVELNYVAVTSLQPSRSWTPQVGLVVSSYF